MSVTIPRQRIASAALRPVLFSGEQEGVLGGVDLPVPRMGDRFAIDIKTAQLRQDDASRTLIAALTAATTDDAIISIGQPGVSAGASNGVVSGNGQGGTSLAIRGLVAGQVIPASFYFSVIHAGRRQVYMTRAAATVSSGGTVSLSIWPMLRFLTVDGEIVELIDPKIEGKLSGFDAGAAWTRNRTDPLGFSIRERQ